MLPVPGQPPTPLLPPEPQRQVRDFRCVRSSWGGLLEEWSLHYTHASGRPIPAGMILQPDVQSGAAEQLSDGAPNEQQGFPPGYVAQPLQYEGETEDGEQGYRWCDERSHEQTDFAPMLVIQRSPDRVPHSNGDEAQDNDNDARADAPPV